MGRTHHHPHRAAAPCQAVAEEVLEAYQLKPGHFEEVDEAGEVEPPVEQRLGEEAEAGDFPGGCVGIEEDNHRLWCPRQSWNRVHEIAGHP